MADDLLEPMIKDLKEKKREKERMDWNRAVQVEEYTAGEPVKPKAEAEPQLMEKITFEEKGKKIVVPEEVKKPEIVDLEKEIMTGEEVQSEGKITWEEKILQEAGKKLIDSYGVVKIFEMPSGALPVYFVPVPKPTGIEKQIITLIKEAATRLITISPYKIRDLEQRRAVYRQRILEIIRANPQLHIPINRYEFYADSVVREMVGYGVIDALVRDDRLEEIMVIAPQKPVYVFHRKHGMLTSNIEFFTDKEVKDLINKIGREVGRRVDISSPLLDARLPDGSRVNATIPPASVAGSTLTIRKFREDPYSIIDLVNMNTITAEVGAYLWTYGDGLGVRPANVLITGGTGSGKTTLLNVLMSMVQPNERVVSIEDTAELNLPLDHWIRLEARPPGLEGKGELTLDILTKNSLRMRPDRIIVGEVRHDEAFTLFTAMNTGHAGSCGTVHSNSPAEAIARVTSPPMNVPTIMMSALDLIIVIHRLHDKKVGTIRRVTEIAEVVGVLEGKPRTNTMFQRDPVEDTIVKTELPSQYFKMLQDFSGLKKKDLEDLTKKRELFLKELAKRNIREIKQVSQEILNYSMRKEEMIKRKS